MRHPHSHPLGMAFAACCLVLSSACSGGGSKESTPPATPQPAGVLGVGSQAPDFTAIDSNGKEFKLSSMKGKVVLLGFSAMWCGPCQAEAPALETLYKDLKSQGFEVVTSLHATESEGNPTPADLQRWKDTYKLTYSVVNPGRPVVKDVYKTKYYPTLHIIDKQGIIRGWDVRGNIDMNKLISDLLK